MLDSDFLTQMADWSLLVYCLVVTGVGLWDFQGRVPAVIKSKYASRVTYMSQLPFAYQWRSAVSTEDLPLFERARVRHLVFVLAVSALSLVMSLNAYINAVAMLKRCYLR